MGGWKVVLEGEDGPMTDADHENLRSFSRNIVNAATAYGLGPSKATVEPAQGTTDVGVKPSEQSANADKQEEAKAEAQAKQDADAAKATADAKAKAANSK